LCQLMCCPSEGLSLTLDTHDLHALRRPWHVDPLSVPWNAGCPVSFLCVLQVHTLEPFRKAWKGTCIAAAGDHGELMHRCQLLGALSAGAAGESLLKLWLRTSSKLMDWCPASVALVLVGAWCQISMASYA